MGQFEVNHFDSIKSGPMKRVPARAAEAIFIWLARARYEHTLFAS